MTTSLIFIFFFSRRGRHTILVSDWSSDVCSSDLSPADLVSSYRLILGAARDCGIGQVALPDFLELEDSQDSLQLAGQSRLRDADIEEAVQAQSDRKSVV